MNAQNCRVKFSNNTYQEARFIGVFQYSKVLEPSAFIGGHKGGVVAFPVAVVEVGGELIQTDLRNVQLESEVKP